MTASVFDLFAASARRYPRNDFLHIPLAACRDYATAPITVGYAAMLARVEARSAAFAAAGYRSGQRVALLLRNRPAFFENWFALNRLGISVVPINAEQPPQETAYMLAHSEAVLLVALSDCLDSARAASALMEVPVAIADCEVTPPPAPAADSREAAAGDECALLYTSGSTGKPKGCILGNDYFTRFGAWYRDIGGLCTLRPGIERLITPLPLSHMNAMATSAMGMIATGGCIVQLDRFHPSSWWDSVRRSGATVVHYLGVMPAILLGMEASASDDFSAQVRFGFGAGVNPRHHAPFEQRFGFPLIEAWAMTETGCGGCVIANREPRHVGTCCFGIPPASLEFRLVDENGNDVEPGTPGELLVRTRGEDPRAGFFRGYLKNPAETAAAWEGGWFHTGDVVRTGEGGVMHFVDRRKNVIRRSGENIAALEVEAALADDPRIEQCVVTAVPDDTRGDEVMACIVARPGVATDADTARAICERARATLSYFKVPGYVVFLDALPRTASQKPQRGEIKQRAAGWLADPRCVDLRALKRNPARAHA